MRAATVIIFITGLAVFFFGGNIQGFARSDRLNYGVKAGLTALSSTKYRAYYAGKPAAGVCTDKNGGVFGTFFRFNYNYVFLQPETSWNFHRQNCGFMLPGATGSDVYLPSALDIEAHAVNSSMLLGYNMTKSKTYLCGAYLGAALKWTYRIRYEDAVGRHYTGRSDFFCYAVLVGFSVSISKIYFDFRYEVNQPDTSLDFGKIVGISESYRNVFLEKNENVLSFSCGVMF
jgi:hypothetical protein